MNLKIRQARKLRPTEVAFIFFNAGMRHSMLRKLSSAGERFVANAANTKKTKFYFKFTRLKFNPLTMAFLRCKMKVRQETSVN